MLRSFRLLYNRLERRLDRHSLQRELERSASLPPDPITAREAFGLALAEVRQDDAGARCYGIASPAIMRAGRSCSWVFHFDLPQRRALASCFFERLRDEDGFPTEVRLTVTLTPWPSPRSALHRLVAEGRLFYGALRSAWALETTDRRYLPTRFVDSPEAMRTLEAEGVDLSGGPDEMTLVAEVRKNGERLWVLEGFTEFHRTPLTR